MEALKRMEAALQRLEDEVESFAITISLADSKALFLSVDIIGYPPFVYSAWQCL